MGRTNNGLPANRIFSVADSSCRTIHSSDALKRPYSTSRCDETSLLLCCHKKVSSCPTLGSANRRLTFCGKTNFGWPSPLGNRGSVPRSTNHSPGEINAFDTQRRRRFGSASSEPNQRPCPPSSLGKNPSGISISTTFSPQGSSSDTLAQTDRFHFVFSRL